MIEFEVIGYAASGTYAELVDAPDREAALKLGKRAIRKWLPKGVKILKWAVRIY